MLPVFTCLLPVWEHYLGSMQGICLLLVFPEPVVSHSHRPMGADLPGVQMWNELTKAPLSVPQPLRPPPAWWHVPEFAASSVCFLPGPVTGGWLAALSGAGEESGIRRTALVVFCQNFKNLPKICQIFNSVKWFTECLGIWNESLASFLKIIIILMEDGRNIN